MTELQLEFEDTGYASWTNADIYPDGKIYTQRYTQWLEQQIMALREQHNTHQKQQLFSYTVWLRKEGLLNATVSRLIVKKYLSK